MTADAISAPVEIAIIEFPGSRFNGEIVPALSQLVEETAGAFDDLDGEVGGLLSEDDLLQAAEALSLGSSALMIVWQDTWATRLVEAVAASGGRLVAHDRLDGETVSEILAATGTD